MGMSCLLITTNSRARMGLVRNAIASLDRCDAGNVFQEKVISVDILRDGTLPMAFFEQFRDSHWQVITGRCAGRRGMAENQLRGMAHLRSELVLYCEDDVLVTRIPAAPAAAYLEEMITTPGKRMGFVCYNTHIHDALDQAPPERLLFINDPTNYRPAMEELFLVKTPILKDDYYLNFPVAIARRDLFLQMHKYARTHCAQRPVEVAMTESWFGMGLDQDYDVLVYVKPNVRTRLPLTLRQFHDEANIRFWNNDASLRHPSISGRVGVYI